MPKKAAEPAKKRKIAVGSHKLPNLIPPGEVITDCFKKEWKLGKPIGSGGFGLIYLTDVNSTKPVSDEAPYAMKLEPHSNGPLFCELAFYHRVAKPELIKEWTQKKGLKNIGVPRYVASGNHTYNKEKFRFMVMDRCGTDLQKFFESNGRQFPDKTVFLLGIKLLYTLEYIHDKDYVHADVKASNILTGFGKAKSGEVYLVDYGLAFKYAVDGKHKEYKEDPKRLHDGTIEFTSRDAHKGVAPSRRGDLEILGYCMLQWLCQKLPWEDKLSDKNYVRDSKIRYMNNIHELEKRCYPGAAYAKEFSQYLQYVANLKYEEKPDYDKCHAWFRRALKTVGGSVSDKLELQMLTRKRPSDEHVGPTKKWRGVNDGTSETPRAKRQSRSTSRSPVKKPSSQKRPRMEASTCNGMTPKVITGRSPRVNSPVFVLQKPAIPSPSKSSGSTPHTKGAASRSVSRLKKKATTLASASTQTSPGLRGLPRTCKRKIRKK